MRITIGISYSTVNLNNYFSWFERCVPGNNFELIELSFVENNLHQFDLCDGFLLTGGDDVHPDFYDGPKLYANMPSSFHPRRDEFEKLMIDHALANNKPILGICRGLQIVNVYFGGKLIPDLNDGNKIHKSAEGVDKVHAVVIEPGSILHHISGSLHGTVNSAHHQAADKTYIGKNLIVNAWSATGKKAIEGLEFYDKTGRPFMLCVQWHPERMPNQQNPLASGILKHFLKEVETTKSNNNANN